MIGGVFLPVKKSNVEVVKKELYSYVEFIRDCKNKVSIIELTPNDAEGLLLTSPDSISSKINFAELFNGKVVNIQGKLVKVSKSD